MFRQEAKTTGWWRVDADTLAASRFVISPLTETVTCLVALEQSEPADPAGRTWLDAHRQAYRERLAKEPVIELLVRAIDRSRWLAATLNE